jgi:hypothetical protein
VAILGFGVFFLVNNLMILIVSLPETLMTAIPDIPGPLERE